MMRVVLLPLALLLSALPALVPPAWAQAYPSRPVRLLVGYPPGGPTDLAARLAGQQLSEALGQPFIIDNRPGAGGTLAMGLLAQSTPDGYALGLGSNGELAISPHLRASLPYDPLKSFIPISRIGASQLVLLVNPSVPAKTVKELVGLARGKPGSVNFASSGSGSTAHLSSELLKHMAGIDLVHVPYKGAAPAMADLMGGQVQMLITGFSGAVPFIKSGKLRGLASTGAKRLVAMPEMPTIAESVPGYEVSSWYGVLAPARTPAPIIALLHRELAAMVKRPDVAERLTAMGIEAEGTSPAAFAAQIADEIAKWGRVVKLAGVKGE
ncbi:MAG: tripartite tricarboxylate transporter substrate binding protein [Burkholderiales bacterium]|nr:tripartite tricarboxylate transporter substrate binding protein [Burkholderiales bacterium]